VIAQPAAIEPVRLDMQPHPTTAPLPEPTRVSLADDLIVLPTEAHPGPLDVAPVSRISSFQARPTAMCPHRLA
jgi:hypothetical protein